MLLEKFPITSQYNSDFFVVDVFGKIPYNSGINITRGNNR